MWYNMPEQVIVYYEDEQLVQICSDQLEQLTIQNELMNQQFNEIQTMQEIMLTVLVLCGAIFGAVVFRHLRK